MSSFSGRMLCVIAMFMAAAVTGVAQSSYDLRSPDSRIELRIRSADRVHYDVLLNGRALLENCTLSMDVEHKKLGIAPKVLDAKQRSNDQIIRPTIRQKFAQLRDAYNELHLTMDGGYAVTFRAYNEGVAYRFETSLPQQQVKVYAEESNWNFPQDSIVYYPQEDSFFSHNERKYTPQHLSEIIPAYIATLPAVVDVGGGAKVAIAESDVHDYPGLWLKGTRGTGRSEEHTSELQSRFDLVCRLLIEKKKKKKERKKKKKKEKKKKKKEKVKRKK